MAVSKKTTPETAPEVWSITQITRRVKSTLEEAIGSVWVVGEISNFRVSPAGHAYFTLKDENSQLAAVMFKGKMASHRFEPEQGMEVIAHGAITVYEPRGAYQIICDELQPKGLGALQLAFERLKKKLAAEGLFDEEHKKPLPLLPRRIGIVTSPTGAAIRDILNVIQRRFAHVHLLLYPARVQGEEAKREIVDGIRALDNYGVDVIIVGRGGGSLEDLWAFNEEPVVRAIHKAKTPIISAVGHEIDYALSDFAADVRAPTPSAAAELVVQEHEALLEKVALLHQRLVRGLKSGLAESRARYERLRSAYFFQRPEELTRQHRQRADELRLQLDHAILGHYSDAQVRLQSAGRSLSLLSPAQQVSRSRERWGVLGERLARIAPIYCERNRTRLASSKARLDALSPIAILSRGYAIVRREADGELVRDGGLLRKDERLAVRFHKGDARVRVEEATGETE